MKKFTKILALVLVVTTVVCVLASCGIKLSGTYAGKADLFGLAGAEVSYKFIGSKVTITSKAKIAGFEKTEIKDAKYEIIRNDDGTLSIKFTYDDGTSAYTAKFAQDKNAKTITIDGITYTKVDTKAK